MASREWRTGTAASVLSALLAVAGCASRPASRAGTDAGGGGDAATEDAGEEAAVTARPTVSAAAGTTLVKVDPSVRHQTFEGWGTSLAWWANHVGGWGETGRDALVDAIV